MKILIITMTCGEGHNMIARAIENEFKKNNFETKTIQLYGFDEKLVKNKNNLFLNIYKHFPKLYDYLWNKVKDKKYKKYSKFVKWDTKNCDKYVLSQINEYQPDVIFCTHVNASIVLSNLIVENKIDKNIITSSILTDFCIHPFWNFSTAIDYLIIPNDEVKDELIEKCYNEEQLIPLGLPSNDKFKYIENIFELRRTLNLDENKFTALLINGGAGLGNTLKVVKNILKFNQDVNIICINGRNKKMYNIIQNYIEKNNLKCVSNLGFVNNVNEYMSASDVIISKAGGSSLSEVMRVQKPIIIREKLIINEKINKKLLINKNCCLGADKIEDIGPLVKKLKNDEKLRKELVNNLIKFNNSNAAHDIVNFFEKKYKEKIEQNN